MLDWQPTGPKGSGSERSLTPSHWPALNRLSASLLRQSCRSLFAIGQWALRTRQRFQTRLTSGQCRSGGSTIRSTRSGARRVGRIERGGDRCWRRGSRCRPRGGTAGPVRAGMWSAVVVGTHPIEADQEVWLELTADDAAHSAPARPTGSRTRGSTASGTSRSRRRRSTSGSTTAPGPAAATPPPPAPAQDYDRPPQPARGLDNAFESARATVPRGWSATG